MDQSPILTGQSDIREVRVVKQGGEDFGAGIIEIGPCKSNLCVGDLHFGDLSDSENYYLTKQGDEDISSFMII